MKKPPLFLAVLLVGCFSALAHAANPSMTQDFSHIVGWLSQELAHGLAFNAGSTFDPPQEIRGSRLMYDMSLGIGEMPLDKGKFPALASQDLKNAGAAEMFPTKVLFPNMTMHLRAGLPGRSDLAVRLTNMTTPPNYKISQGTGAKGQSNSVGFVLRKHFLGEGEWPMLSLCASYNYIFGRFKLHSRTSLTDPDFGADADIIGTLQWNVKSLGVNAVMSQTFGAWTPFVGFGYNTAFGTVRTRLELLAKSPILAPVVAEASRGPEPTSSRLIMGTQWNHSWINFFSNGEVKATGVNAGKSWIVHGGLMLPFGFSRNKSPAQKRELVPGEMDAEQKPPWFRWKTPAPRFRTPPEPLESDSPLIFIQ